MTSFKLKRSIQLKDEQRRTLDVHYFLIEDNSNSATKNIKQKNYGIKVDTNYLGMNKDSYCAFCICENIEDALYVINKMADHSVTAMCAQDVIEDMVF